MNATTINNLTAAVEGMSRYNWLTVTAEAEGKEPQTFHATGINTHMGNFIAFDRQCATGFYTDNAVVDIAVAGENTFAFLTASGTAYTVTGGKQGRTCTQGHGSGESWRSRQLD